MEEFEVKYGRHICLSDVEFHKKKNKKNKRIFRIKEKQMGFSALDDENLKLNLNFLKKKI